MKRNLGSTDKSLRMAIGFSMIAAGAYYDNILWIFGIPIAITGIVGWCPIYAFFGKSTHEK
jgi:hypothetical protein